MNRCNYLKRPKVVTPEVRPGYGGYSGIQENQSRNHCNHYDHPWVYIGVYFPKGLKARFCWFGWLRGAPA